MVMKSCLTTSSMAMRSAQSSKHSFSKLSAGFYLRSVILAVCPDSASSFELAVDMFYAIKVSTMVGSTGVGCKPKPCACLPALCACEASLLNSNLMYGGRMSMESAVRLGMHVQ